MATITREDYEALANDVDSRLGGDVDIRDDYSGRGMMGDECLAVVGDSYTLDLFLTAAHKYAPKANVRLGNMKQDHMGKSTVFYWPHVEVEKEVP